jgi:hypothetical protein
MCWRSGWGESLNEEEEEKEESLEGLEKNVSRDATNKRELLVLP